MDKDAIAFLDGETETETEEVVEESTPEVEEQPEPEAEARAEEQTGEEGETPSPEPEKSRDIPVTALLDEREKRQEAQRRAEEADRRAKSLEAELREMRTPKEEAPDWYDDPQKAAEYQQNTVLTKFETQRMQQSKFFAEREFGADTVKETIAYFDRNPAASQQFMAHPSPFHAAVEFYQRQKVVEEVGADPEAYRAKLAEEIRAELEAQYSANGQKSQSSKPKAPPPSMASAPASGRETISPGTGFDALFPES